MAIASLPSVPDASETVRRTHRKIEPVFWWMTIPTLIVFTLAIPVPAVVGIFYSFTNYIGVGKWHFLGLANYIAMFSDPQIRQSYIFTIGFALVTVIAVNVISFLLAVGLSARIRAKVALRTIFVIPMVISGIVIAYVFQFLFSNSLPAVGQSLGIGWLQQSLVTNPHLAWLAVVFVTAWSRFREPCSSTSPGSCQCLRTCTRPLISTVRASSSR
ncbi:carbohydrate ABC transporter permease [Bifidobacterium sp.]|jgi:raffinose/stachyose/melibiose transport system permease protein|uniref:carbohydrate ABC transporter permease n=1 Tax=Bifidobacterium sp. TaxID=41200 RepID=UPI0025C3CDDB|nr:sugar ABC transporter permease [Bifidobacterium sp.]MCH4209553.1 sugar ABC transporter permease [Bifidobacterium sp.]